MSELEFDDELKGYFDEKDFQRFILAIPQLDVYAKPNPESTRSPPINAFDLQVFFIIAYYTALRPVEIKRLKPDDFDLKNRLLNATNRKGNLKRTTIAPPALPILQYWLKVKKLKRWETSLFEISRSTLWSYCKAAGKKAGIEYFDQFEKRNIEGLYTYLFKHAYGQRMEELRCPGSLISLKLRHSKSRGRDGMQASTMNYTQSLKRLLVWESKNIKEVIQLA